MKLFRRETETDALEEWLRRDPRKIASTLARLEVRRAVKRAGNHKTDRDRVDEFFSQVALIRIDESILERAASLDPQKLASLDAVHVASALSVASAIDGVVTYDKDLGEAARLAGLAVIAPR